MPCHELRDLCVVGVIALDLTLRRRRGAADGQSSTLGIEVGLVRGEPEIEADAGVIGVGVYRGTTLVGASGNSTSTERVNLLNPVAGSYTVYVHGFGVTGTANFTLFSWLLGSASAGNMGITAPSAATLGGSGSIGLTFSGLTPGTKYLGSVAYSGAAGLPNPTVVRVDP